MQKGPARPLSEKKSHLAVAFLLLQRIKAWRVPKRQQLEQRLQLEQQQEQMRQQLVLQQQERLREQQLLLFYRKQRGQQQR
jgi:hypothetical protein